MIILKEAFNLDKIRSFMKQRGFEEFEGFLTSVHDNSGSLMFKNRKYLVIYNYPRDSITIQKEDASDVFSFYIKNIKKFNVSSGVLFIESADGSAITLYD